MSLEGFWKVILTRYSTVISTKSDMYLFSPNLITKKLSWCTAQEPAGPLKGVVIAVAKKLSKQQSDYNNMAAELGADYRWTYDLSCTHFIFQVCFKKIF